VFPDADLEQAVQTTITAIFFNTGECCCAGSRLFVHEDIKDEFLDELAAAAEDLTVDDPLLDATDLGPKVTAEQVERTMSYIEEAEQSRGRPLSPAAASPTTKPCRTAVSLRQH